MTGVLAEVMCRHRYARLMNGWLVRHAWDPAAAGGDGGDGVDDVGVDCDVGVDDGDSDSANQRGRWVPWDDASSFLTTTASSWLTVAANDTSQEDAEMAAVVPGRRLWFDCARLQLLLLPEPSRAIAMKTR